MVCVGTVAAGMGGTGTRGEGRVVDDGRGALPDVPTDDPAEKIEGDGASVAGTVALGVNSEIDLVAGTADRSTRLCVAGSDSAY